MEIETINKQEKQDPAAPIFSKCLKVHETPKSKRRRNFQLAGSCTTTTLESSGERVQ
jgi:hypothetical protein